mgnify:CR=1 FL=1
MRYFGIGTEVLRQRRVSRSATSSACGQRVRDFKTWFLNYLTPEEQVKFVFPANRSGRVDQVAPGDILVGGRKFGTGSSRPTARPLRYLKLACVVAQSINGLFLRNSVNFGFPAIECRGSGAAFEERDVVEV